MKIFTIEKLILLKRFPIVKLFTLASIAILFTLQSCKKNNLDAMPAIADIDWGLNVMRATNDSDYSDAPFPNWKLVLNNDKTFVFELSNDKCTGTYSWSPTSVYTANIKFTINQWTNPSSDSLLGVKLRDIVSGINICEFPGTPLFQVVFSGNTGMFRTQKL